MIHTLITILCSLGVTLLAILGFIEILQLIILLIFKGRNNNYIMVISPVSNNENETEFTLRSMFSSIKRTGRLKPDRVILLDTGMSDNTKKICNLICDEYEYPELMNKEELYTAIDNINRIQ